MIKRKMLAAVRWMSVAALLCAPAFAQSGEGARPAFEVISIKPTVGQQQNSGFRRASGGMLNATNVTVRFLIGYAYDLRDDQITGGPAWIDSERYEIVAKPAASEDAAGKPAGNSASLLRQRTQTLLADRFHLVLHRDTKEMPILVLTVGKNGPKGLRPSDSGRPDFVSNGHHLNCQRVSMAMFAKDFLARQTGRTVVDKTGIAGDFDFTLDWTSDDAPAPPADGGPAVVQFPPLMLAIEEQLGLKVERQKGPVEVLAIDHVERPAAN